MQIVASHDFNRPRAQVLTRFRDPARIESVLKGLVRGVRQTGKPPAPTWTATIKWRGGERPLDLAIRETTPGAVMEMTIKADIADATVVFRFADLPGGACRVTAEATPAPHTLVARVAVASMGLVKKKLVKRLAKLIAALGKP